MKNPKKKRRKVMLYCSQNSGIVHFNGCHHQKRIRLANARAFVTYDDAVKAGFRMCKCCDPIMKAYKAESEALIKYCAENGLICFAKDSTVHLPFAIHGLKVNRAVFCKTDQSVFCTVLDQSF